MIYSVRLKTIKQPSYWRDAPVVLRGTANGIASLHGKEVEEDVVTTARIYIIRSAAQALQICIIYISQVLVLHIIPISDILTTERY